VRRSGKPTVGDNGLLLHGLELREAIRWLEQAPAIKDQQPTPVHQQYIRTSEEWEAGEVQRLTELSEEKERWRREAEKLKQEILLREHVSMVRRHVLRVFLCHASEDETEACTLYDRLRNDGYRPWLDVKDIVPGQDWKMAITIALKMSHVVIVLLSQKSVKKSGFVNREINDAREIAKEKPEGMIFLIPLRLDQCKVPSSLEDWQWVDFFQPDGYDKIVKALEERVESAVHETLALLPSTEVLGDQYLGTGVAPNLSSHAERLLVQAQDDSSYAISTSWFETPSDSRLVRLKTGHLQVADEAYNWQRALDVLQQHGLILLIDSEPAHRDYKITRNGWAVAELVRQSLVQRV
jgi:TIR domain